MAKRVDVRVICQDGTDVSVCEGEVAVDLAIMGADAEMCLDDVDELIAALREVSIRLKERAGLTT